MSLISDFVKGQDIPIFDCAEYAQGCESFIFRAKTEKECWTLCDQFLGTVPDTKRVKAYRIGLRPDYPIPVARYFIEVSVDDLPDFPYQNFFSPWTYVAKGRLKA